MSSSSKSQHPECPRNAQFGKSIQLATISRASLTLVFTDELNERKGIKDKLSTLNRLTQDAAKMATVILEVARLIKSGVGAAGGNVNEFTEGTFSTSFSLASLVVETEIL